MKNLLVIDTSVYLNYARHKKLYRLSYCVEDYGLNLFVDDNLLKELERNLTKVLFFQGHDPSEALEEILEFTTLVQTIPIFTQSPDPKDNFLFDLALQTNSEVIVTEEKALLGFVESPVPIHDIRWFKETYPVNL